MGAVEAVATLRSLGAPRALDPAKNVALSSSFGFGGHNAVLALVRLMGRKLLYIWSFRPINI
jgi:3-oxoacyl-(acyl-carrier-protein) synthase